VLLHSIWSFLASRLLVETSRTPSLPLLWVLYRSCECHVVGVVWLNAR
jgi:hypothetical protein